MKRLSIMALSLGVSAVAGQAFAANVEVTVNNGSSYEVHELYVSPASQEDWGPDQLGESIINPGASYTLQGVPTGTYDVKIEDEDGDTCIASNMTIAEHGSIDLNDTNLIGCEDETEEAAEG